MMDQKKKPMTIQELNRIYREAETVDAPIFAEQRSNCLLAIGDHYNRKNSYFWSRIRDSTQLTEEQKLRLTKNHTHRVCSIYANNIFAQAPGVDVIPKNEKELQHQKAAELHSSVWHDWKDENEYRPGLRRRIEDFVKVGEVAGKLFWDPNAGKFLGYKQGLHPDSGEPMFDAATGQPIAGDDPEPVFAGKICYERIFAPNLLRHPQSKEMLEDLVCYRKMVDLKYLQGLYGQDDEKSKFIKAGSQDIYTVFDGTSGNYHRMKDQIMVREFFQPVSYEYPLGYFWITTELGILDEDTLPAGFFPILFTGFDEVPTSPRKRSIIKQIRPFQAELNRAGSAIATAQITLGDDKLLVMKGTNVTQAAKLPGVRVLNYAGTAPGILAGRSGDQYAAYYQAQKSELYEAAGIPEENEEKNIQVSDPFAELFKSIRHKKKYVIYAEKIVEYEKKLCEGVLTLAKLYYDEKRLIPVIGKNEMVNISEFKNSTPICYEIKVVEQGDDYETKMGKQLTLNTALQYVGNQMDKEDIGRILRVMPYTNKEEIFTDLTTDYDDATNDILALDRGELPQIRKYDNHKYMIKRLVHRTKQSDFQFLPQLIQANYANVIGMHEQNEEQNIQQIQQAESGFIPASGPLIAVDFYIADPEKPSRTRRARIPYDAVSWLVNKLQSQGMELSQLEKVQDSAVSEMAGHLLKARLPPAGGGGPSFGSGSSMGPYGMPMPQATPSVSPQVLR